nr:DUF604 domain-containing protein [Ipomoea batatas]
MKGFLGICLVGSISLFSFLAFSKLFWCSEYQNIFISTSSQFSTGYDVRLHSDETNISHILFGIGGSAKTWNYRRHYCEAWWKPNVTRGFVWLDERPPENESWPETSPRFQMDIRLNPYGVLAAHPVAPLVSLHHLDYVQPLFPGTSQEESVKKLVEAYKSDPSRTLQHSFCYDLSRNWSISVAWGYTIQLYPTLVNAKELATPFRTFLTWKSWNEGPFTFDVRRMSSDPCEKPLMFYLNHVHNLGNGSTVTTYTRPKVDGNQCQNEIYAPALLVHSFNVSAQILSPEIWKKVPRRQCCEVVNDGDGAEGILQVKLRGCNQWESVTPP